MQTSPRRSGSSFDSRGRKRQRHDPVLTAMAADATRSPDFVSGYPQPSPATRLAPQPRRAGRCRLHRLPGFVACRFSRSTSSRWARPTSAALRLDGVALSVTPAMTALLALAWGRLAEVQPQIHGAAIARRLRCPDGRDGICHGAMAPVALRVIQGVFAGYGRSRWRWQRSAKDGWRSRLGSCRRAALGPALGPVIGAGVVDSWAAQLLHRDRRVLPRRVRADAGRLRRAGTATPEAHVTAPRAG